MTFRFDSKLVSIGVEAHDREEAIHVVADPLVRYGYVGESYPNLVCEREREYPTGLPTKGVPVALSHADGVGQIQGNHIAVGILKTPVGFQSMEDADEQLAVGIIFVLAMSNAHAHLEMLKVLMGLIRNEDLLVSLGDMSTAREVCSALNDFIESVRPAAA